MFVTTKYFTKDWGDEDSLQKTRKGWAAGFSTIWLLGSHSGYQQAPLLIKPFHWTLGHLSNPTESPSLLQDVSSHREG